MESCDSNEGNDNFVFVYLSTRQLRCDGSQFIDDIYLYHEQKDAAVQTEHIISEDRDLPAIIDNCVVHQQAGDAPQMIIPEESAAQTTGKACLDETASLALSTDIMQSVQPAALEAPEVKLFEDEDVSIPTEASIKAAERRRQWVLECENAARQFPRPKIHNVPSLMRLSAVALHKALLIYVPTSIPESGTSLEKNAGKPPKRSWKSIFRWAKIVKPPVSKPATAETKPRSAPRRRSASKSKSAKRRSSRRRRSKRRRKTLRDRNSHVFQSDNQTEIKYEDSCWQEVKPPPIESKMQRLLKFFCCGIH